MLRLATSLLVATGLSSTHANYYCGNSYTDALDCSAPCPGTFGYNPQVGNNECPEDRPYCFGPGLACVEQSSSNETAVERLSAQDPANMKFCGLTLEDANICSTDSHWCPSGQNTECPHGMHCFENTACNATELNLVDLDSLNLTAYSILDNETDALDSNPSHYYCSDTWRTAEYSGDCGPPCPSGQNSECPDGLFCYGPSPNCVETHKAGVGSKWCGVSYNDMASKCSTECPGGTDEECGEGETCWGDSPCALLDFEPMDVNASIGKLWCGRSYKDLVENCPAECPSGLDEECGDDMICFNMSEEEQSCNETGVGIREPVDSANLWCGSSWNNVLEECRAGCPEGTDEECATYGIGMICYDMTGSDLICEEAGIGVKEKGDPQTRWCGTDYNDMLSSCPKRCPETTECDEGQTCFEGSPCVTEGVAVDVPDQDPDKMFCGSDFTAAMSCSTPCPNGDSDCVGGESCFAEVECLWGAQDDDNGEALTASSSTLAANEEALTASSSTVAADGDALTASSSTEAAETSIVSETSSSVSNMVMDLNSEALIDSDEAAEQSAEEPAPVDQNTDESAPVEQSAGESAPVEQSAEDTAAVEQSAEVSASAKESSNANFFEEASSNEVTSSGLVADNVRMALYGLSEMTSDHISAWETLTASYFEEFYNDYTGTSDVTRAAVSDVETWFEFTALNLAASRRVLNVRRRLQGSAHLITYTQRTRYTTDGDATLGYILQGPFSDPTKRANYIQYLMDTSDLFSGLQGVSTVFLPKDLSQSSPAASASASEASPDPEPTSNSMVNPFEDEDKVYTSNQSTQPYEHSTDCIGSKYQSFFCHNSGEACPCGTCADNDACIFISDGSAPVDVGSYIISQSNPASSDSGHAAEMVDAVLNFGATLDTEMTTTTTAPSGSESDPLPYSLAEYGPTTVQGTMTLTGMNMIEVDSIYEWQYLTAVFEQNFFNMGEPMGDAIKDAIHNFATVLEIVDLSYGYDAGAPTTIIKFEQVFKYDAPDSVLSPTAIATRPFLNQEDRDAYIAYLKKMLPNTFGSLQSSSREDVTDSENHPNDVMNFLMKLTETFYCSESWPVDCSVAQSCTSGDNCPQGQKCYTAPMCASNAEEYNVPIVSTTTAAPETTSGVPDVTTPATNSTSADIKETSVLPPELSLGVMEFNSAALESDGSEEEETTFDFTYPEQFYCGKSWLDASDRCHTPCPNGDASVCGEDESCFAFTSCQQKESFFCGASFEHASSTCNYPCSGLSVFDCPQGMGCFQYTTCQGVHETAAGTESEESGVPLDSFCGTSLEDAELSCATGHAIACQGGNDGQCPGDMECFETTSCNARDSFYCGTNWKNAAETCGTPCSSGSSDECGEGEFCFAHTGCESNLFFCGETFDDASESCDVGTPTSCSSKNSDQCPDGQYCFAFVSSCAGHVDNISLGAFGDFETFVGSDPLQEEPSWMAGYWEMKSISPSSTRTRTLSLVLSSIFIVFFSF